MEVLASRTARGCCAGGASPPMSSFWTNTLVLPDALHSAKRHNADSQTPIYKNVEQFASPTISNHQFVLAASLLVIFFVSAGYTILRYLLY